MSGATPIDGIGALSGAEAYSLVAGGPPSDIDEFNSVTVSPGLPGFLAMFLLALVVVLLVVDMTRRVRRVQARARVEERMAATERTEREEQGEEESDPAEERPSSDPDDPSAEDGGQGRGPDQPR